MASIDICYAIAAYKSVAESEYFPHVLTIRLLRALTLGRQM